MPTLDELKPYKDALPLPQDPNPFDLRGQGTEVETTVTIQYLKGLHYSSQLGPTHAWSYEGTVPGPFFIVDQKQTVHVRWANNIAEKETLPYQVVVFPDSDQASHQNEAGATGGVVDDRASALTASTVTHLHGGLTAPDSDGWSENVYPFGRSQHSTYGKAGLPDGKEQRGALLWYHDHGMGVTRLNVYAGLFGLWILRDPAEHEAIKAKLLPGEDNELFLVIQDRNFAADKDGNLTGELLHKTETTTAEMFGPCTLVNGKLWPTCDVPARPVRLRILNGSNARTYCLRLVKSAPVQASQGHVKYTPLDVDTPLPVWQVGTDGGLLDHPVNLSEPTNPNGLNLVLAPAERADLVVDFTRFPNETLAFVNTAFAPFHGATVTNPNKFNQDGTTTPELDPADPTGKTPLKPADAGSKAPDFRLPFPHVLQFVVGAAGKRPTPSRLTEESTLDKAFRRFVHKAGDAGDQHLERVLPPNHNHRWIALTENPPGDLTFRELVAFTTDADVAAATPADTPLIPISALNGVVTWYRTVGKAFHDAARFFIEAGGCEVWNFLNLTGDTHPVHLHLVQFQILSRQRHNASSSAAASAPSSPVKPLEIPQPPDANEQGFKDTVRINPGEVVSIAAFFEGYCGKYMYHCHILEHEDHDMMRPFIVVAPDAFALMSMEMDDMMRGKGGMKM